MCGQSPMGAGVAMGQGETLVTFSVTLLEFIQTNDHIQ